MLIAEKKIIKQYEETMSFNLSQIGLSHKLGNLILVQTIKRSHTRHHVQKKENRTTTTEDLVLAPNFFISVTEKKFFQTPK